MSAPRDEVGEFAALLTRLKERTDRSYGSLARRLNMNTSTLHRYCAGEAVPQDFAPVERFAALCGATAEERLELHRLWLPAVAARQRPRAAATETGPTEAAADTEVGSADGEPGSTDNEPAPPASEAPAPPLRHPWYRRRRTLVSAAVAAVLVVTLGSISALPSGSPGADDSAQSSRGPSDTTAPGTPGRHHNSATSPSPSATTSGSPSAKGTEGTEGTGSQPSKDPDQSRSPSGSHKQDGSGTPSVPLTWTADSQVWALGCGHDYVIAKPPAEVPPPPAPQDAGTWAGTQNAVHGRDTNVRISVQGRTSTAVVLEALRVRVVGRTDPAPGTAYSMDQGCGGAVTPRYFDVDLDIDRPIARPVAGNDTGTPIPAMRLPYRVSAEDPEVLLVTAKTEGCDCRWYLELDWSSQGRTGTVRIDDDGRPFRTSSIKGLPRYWYDVSRQWVERTD
ncbi:helix-turn-helix domain-containing protein [Streptomyces sp. NBC_01352]|uniref:helix-turn-helix domain-containing protein n=1 Tax=Streptomyces sp. NBC_01352 TaxID=2903834 RepID=UPI002E32DCC4|nr:helix-turn-helix domain-containing protein [Streptomyces sp. NBC_01352]